MDVVLTNQLSSTECVFGTTFGCVDSTTMYTNGGCRGDFTINGIAIRCEANNGLYAECGRNFIKETKLKNVFPATLF